MSENLDILNSTLVVSDRCGIEETSSSYAPREGTLYYYRWGNRELGRGSAVDSISITPAVLLPPNLDDEIPEGGLVEFDSLQEAKQYCWETGEGERTRIVIVLRVHDELNSPPLRLERADYPGYIRTLTYASQLTGLKFEEMHSPYSPDLVTEEPLSLGYRIRLLRRYRRQGKDLEARMLEMQVRVDFKHRHDRNVKD